MVVSHRSCLKYFSRVYIKENTSWFWIIDFSEVSNFSFNDGVIANHCVCYLGVEVRKYGEFCKSNRFGSAGKSFDLNKEYGRKL